MRPTKGKFCDICPRRLGRPPTEPCPLAMQYIAAKVIDPKKEPDYGCPWAISSAANGNCFWSYADSIDGERVPDKEICDLLGINQATLEKVLGGALDKLKANKDSATMQAWREAVLEAAARNSQDQTVYLPDSFRLDAGLTGADDEELPQDPLPATPPPRRSRSQPLHRDGKKTDLFGLSSPRKSVV